MTPREQRLAKKFREQLAYLDRCVRRSARLHRDLKAFADAWAQGREWNADENPLRHLVEGEVFHVPMPDGFDPEHGFIYGGVK